MVLKPIGKAKASTFFGFCDYHDSFLFAEIENEPFVDNETHCFLHSYRAFAHSQHRKSEQIRAFSNKSEFLNTITTNREKLLEGTLIGYEEGEITRKRFNEIIDNNSYSELETLTIRYSEFYPIACSSSFTPKYSPKTNTGLNNHTDKTILFEPVFINIIPDLDGTILILSCLPEHEKSLRYIDEFDSLNSIKQDKILSSITIGEIENVFISPHIYNKLTLNEKKILIEELKNTTIFTNSNNSSHFISKLNFFEDRFIK